MISRLAIPDDSNVILLAKIERDVKLSRRRFSSYIGTVKKFPGYSPFFDVLIMDNSDFQKYFLISAKPQSA